MRGSSSNLKGNPNQGSGNKSTEKELNLMYMITQSMLDLYCIWVSFNGNQTKCFLQSLGTYLKVCVQGLVDVLQIKNELHLHFIYSQNDLYNAQTSYVLVDQVKTC